MAASSVADSSCFYVKREGDKCVRKRSDDPQCSKLIDYCKQDPQMYKSVCDEVWDVDCDQYSSSDLSTIIKRISLCRYLRKKHSDLCYDQPCQREGHLGAVKKMENKLSYCSTRKRSLDTTHQSNSQFLEGMAHMMGRRFEISQVEGGYQARIVDREGKGLVYSSYGRTADDAILELATLIRQINQARMAL